MDARVAGPAGFCVLLAMAVVAAETLAGSPPARAEVRRTQSQQADADANLAEGGVT